jgi:uncharacterized membrane protein SirB2
VLRNRITNEFRKGWLVGFAFAMVIIGPFGFFALSDTHPSDVTRAQFAFVFFTALGIVSFIFAIAEHKKKKNTDATGLKSVQGSKIF